MNLSQLIIYTILFFVLGLAAVSDFRIRKIPNWLTYTTIAMALCYHLLNGGRTGFTFSIAGLGLGTGIFFIFYLKGWMGAGDAKLMGAVGAALGAKAVFIIILYTSIVGGLYALIILLNSRRTFNGFFREKWEGVKYILLTRSSLGVTCKTDEAKLCYGVAIALGTYIYLGLELSPFGQLIQ